MANLEKYTNIYADLATKEHTYTVEKGRFMFAKLTQVQKRRA